MTDEQAIDHLRSLKKQSDTKIELEKVKESHEESKLDLLNSTAQKLSVSNLGFNFGILYPPHFI